MTIINLLRHGETSGGNVYRGITNQPLTKKGWQQMRNAVEDQSHWQQIVSSPLLRCAEFSEYISKQLNIPLSLDERLQEINFGDWENRTAEDIYEQTPDQLTRFWGNPLEHSPPNGEQLHSMQRRVLSAYRSIIDSEKRTLVITHGGPIRIILCHQRNISLNKLLNKLLNIDVPLASLHKVTFAEKCPN